MPFVIAKSCREPRRESYSGFSCGLAGVEPGLVYATRKEAEIDAQKLTAVNPIGFIVHPQPKNGQ